MTTPSITTPTITTAQATPTMTTVSSAPSAPKTATGSAEDYQTLISEIKTTIDKNDALFKKLQQSNYPNAGSYNSDLLNYKIDTQVTDLTKARQEIWDFLNKKYAENTKLRTYYFDEIRKADEHIKDLNEQQQILIDSIQGKQLKSSTSDESIKNEKYNYNKMEYYLYLYKVLLFVQIAILAVITLCITGIIPRATCLIITVIFLIATSAFVGYYIFFVNIGRSMFSWAKFEHDNSIATNNQCSDSSTVSDSDKKKAAANAAVQDLIVQNRASGKSCSATA
jgi:hypothetical protein